MFIENGTKDNLRPRLNTVSGGSSMRQNITPRRKAKYFLNEEIMMINKKKITDMLKEKIASTEAHCMEVGSKKKELIYS